MSGGLLNETTLRDKLAKINTTQQVIETTSAWVCFFPKDARRIALVWEDVFSKSDQPKRLALLYLANDVLQNSRKKGPEFVTEFFKVLPRALRHMLSKADDKTAVAVNKVVRVWEERRVFGSGSKSFKQLMEEADASGSRSKPPALPALPSPGAAEGLGGSLPSSPTSPAAALAAAAKLPSLEPLVQALQQVHQAALRCTQLSTACRAAAAAAAGGGPGEVASGKAGLQLYLVGLHQEREARQAAVAALQGLLRSQEEAGARLVSQLEQAAGQLEALEERRRQLGAAGGPAVAVTAPAPAVPAAPQQVAAPAQLLGDLVRAPMQPAPMQAAPMQAVPMQVAPHPQPMYNVAAGQSVQHAAQQGQNAAQQAVLGGDDQPEMDLSEDYLPAAARAPMQRHPSLQQQDHQQQQQHAAATAAPVAQAPPLPMQQPPQLQPPAPAAPAGPAPALAPPLQYSAGLALPTAQPPQSELVPVPAAPTPAAGAAGVASMMLPLASSAPLARVRSEAPGGGGAAADAAALAAQLTSNEQSAQALLEALLALPRENGNAAMSLAGLLQPEPQQSQHGGSYVQHAQRAQHAEQQQQGVEGDEYDPEDPFGD